MKHFLFIAVIFFPVFSTNGQPPDIEAINARLDTIKNPSNYCQFALNSGTKLKRYNQIDASVDLFNKALLTAQDAILPELEIAAMYEISIAIDMSGDTEKALQILQDAILKMKNINYFRAGQIYKQIARFFRKQESLDSAVHYLSKAESWYKQQPSEKKYYLWSVYDHWHTLYLQFGDLNKAQEYLDKAYTIVRERNKSTDIAYVLNRLQELSLKRGDAAKYAFYNKAYYDILPRRRKQGLSHGISAPEEFSTKEQIQFFTQLLSENQELNFVQPNFQIQKKLARLLLNQENPSYAAQVLQSMDKSLADKADSVEIYSMYEEAYSSLGRLDQALLASREVIRLKDELNDEKEVQQLLELEKKYQTAQKEQELALAHLREEAQEAELVRTRKQRNAYIMSAVFLILLLGLIGYLAFQNRKQNQLLQKQNDKVRQALKDKEILLREIHHRVKNNLQVVSSLLNLQSQYISDEEALKAILEGKNRVSSMALIHQNLYREDGLTSIDAREYFISLIESLLDSYQVDDEQIDLELKVDQIELDVETMIPLGLIANELISNVLKHAFLQKGDQNRLYFGLWEEDESLKLEIRDNGVGMNPEDFFNSPNFGNKLIQAFLKKLRAEIKVENRQGSRILLQISKYKKAA